MCYGMTCTGLGLSTASKLMLVFRPILPGEKPLFRIVLEMTVATFSD